MNKKLKLIVIIAVTATLLLYWAILALTGTKLTMANYVWQACLSVAAIAFGTFGMLAAKHWSWLKSGVGQGVFFISLGLLIWGVGQAGWTYFVIRDPANQTPPTHILDYIYFSSIPLWAYGMFRLSQATGAKYGLKGIAPKIGVLVMAVILLAFSYYLLVVVARGGLSYYKGWGDWQGVMFDIGYAAGDAINLTLALAIFGLSWKYLGGVFKRPVLAILSGFALIYLSDFLFSFYDGKKEYYNGHWTDILYLAMVATFGAGLCLLDPAGYRQPAPQPAAPQPNPSTEPNAAAPSAPPQPVTTAPVAEQAPSPPVAVAISTPEPAAPEPPASQPAAPVPEQPPVENKIPVTVTSADSPAPPAETPATPAVPEQSTETKEGVA